MQEPPLVGIVDSAGHRCQPAYAGARVGGEPRNALGEAATLDEFHGEEGLSVVRADLVNRHDVRVIQAGDRLRLAPETEMVGERSQPVGADHLQGNQPPQAPLPSLVNNTHASLADPFQQIVIADALARSVRDRRVRRSSRRQCLGFSRAGEPLHLVAATEVRLQFRGQIGIPADELVSIDCLSAIDALHVVG